MLRTCIMETRQSAGPPRCLPANAGRAGRDCRRDGLTPTWSAPPAVLSTMSRSMVRQDEFDELEPQQALPCSLSEEEVDEEGEETWAGQTLPRTAEEYLRMVRRQAKGLPDVVFRPLAPSQPVMPVSVKLPAAMSDIEACPDALQPSVEWERTFLRTFDALRRDVSNTLEMGWSTQTRASRELPEDEDTWIRCSPPARPRPHY